MASSEPEPTPHEASAHSQSMEVAQPPEALIEDLEESQSELLSRIQGMKENIQSWRSTMDTQLKSYQDELSGLKKQLETELENLSLDFTQLKTTLQKQQEDVANSLKNLGLKDASKHSEETETESKGDSVVTEQTTTTKANDEAKTSETEN